MDHTRFVTYWREGPLRATFANAGWTVVQDYRPGRRTERWLVVAGVRRYGR